MDDWIDSHHYIVESLNRLMGDFELILQFLIWLVLVLLLVEQWHVRSLQVEGQVPQLLLISYLISLVALLVL